MSKPAVIVLTIMITVAILAALSNARHVAWIIDNCKPTLTGKSCRMSNTSNP